MRFWPKTADRSQCCCNPEEEDYPVTGCCYVHCGTYYGQDLTLSDANGTHTLAWDEVDEEWRCCYTFTHPGTFAPSGSGCGAVGSGTTAVQFTLECVPGPTGTSTGAKFVLTQRSAQRNCAGTWRFSRDAACSGGRITSAVSMFASGSSPVPATTPAGLAGLSTSFYFAETGIGTPPLRNPVPGIVSVYKYQTMPDLYLDDGYGVIPLVYDGPRPLPSAMGVGSDVWWGCAMRSVTGGRVNSPFGGCTDGPGTSFDTAIVYGFWCAFGRGYRLTAYHQGCSSYDDGVHAQGHMTEIGCGGRWPTGHYTSALGGTINGIFADDCDPCFKWGPVTQDFPNPDPSYGEAVYNPLREVFGSSGSWSVFGAEGAGCDRVPIRVIVTTDTPTTPPLDPPPPTPGAHVSATPPGGDPTTPPSTVPMAGETGADGGFETSVPPPPPGTTTTVDVTVVVPGHPGLEVTTPVVVDPPTATPPTPVVVPIVLTPPVGTFPLPGVTLDPIPDPVILTPNADPIFGDLAGTPIPLPLVTTPTPAPPGPLRWETCVEIPDHPGVYLYSIFQLVPGDPNAPPSGTVILSRITGSCGGVPDATVTLPPTSGSVIHPIAVTAGPPPEDPPVAGPAVVVTTPVPACRTTYPETLSVTLGAESAYGPYAGGTFTPPRNVEAGGITYSMTVGSTSPRIFLSVSYNFAADGTPIGTGYSQLLYPGFAPPAIPMAAPPLTNLCPLDMTLSSTTPPATATVVEGAPPTPTPCDPPGIPVSWHFIDDFYDGSTPSIYFHIEAWSGDGRTLLATTAPITGATYGILDARTTGDFFTRYLWRYDSALDLEPGLPYVLKAYTSSRTGHPAADGTRTLIGTESVVLRCTRLMVLGCGFDGPELGTILDDGDRAGLEDWRAGRFIYSLYGNRRLVGSTVVVREDGAEVAAGMVGSQGAAYLDWTPAPGTTYDLEVTPTESSGYPSPQVFALADVADPDVDLRGLDEPVLLSNGIDIFVDGCGTACGLPGATVTLTRAEIADPDVVVDTWEETTDAYGFVHFDIQVVPGVWTDTATPPATGPLSLLEPVVDVLAELFPENMEDVDEFASSPVYEVYRRLVLFPADDTRECVNGPDACTDASPDSLEVTLGPESAFGADAGQTFTVPREAAYTYLYSSGGLTIRVTKPPSCENEDGEPYVEVNPVGLTAEFQLDYTSGSVACPVAFSAASTSPAGTVTVAE